jgi:hypothetical protein
MTHWKIIISFIFNEMSEDRVSRIDYRIQYFEFIQFFEHFPDLSNVLGLEGDNLIFMVFFGSQRSGIQMRATIACE